MHTIWAGGFRCRTIQLLLTLLRLELLLLRDLSLLLEHLLSLDGGKKIMGFEIFRVVVADALLLHLFVFLGGGQIIIHGRGKGKKEYLYNG